MMKLKSKLSRLQAQTGKHQTTQQPDSAGSYLQRRLERIRIDRITAVSPQTQAKTSEEMLAQRLKGYLIGDGVIQIQQRIPLSGRLGRHALSLLGNPLQLPGEGREAHLRQVYIDTETTGLSGGSGTLAFLIGLAVVEQDALVVTQYLITCFAGEAVMLKAFAGALTADDRLVSYNGKSFDLPLMITRYRMQDQAHPFDGLPHLDLLHPVRRLFNKRWPDCRLMTLEKALLGFQRQHDLPGSEAPAAWSDYLRQGRAEQLIRVVEHNRQDILSLALAHGVVVQAIETPETHGVDIVALAQWWSKINGTEAYALLKATPQPLSDRGKRLLAHLARRAEDWSLAVGLWETLAKQGCRDSAEQLAKYHEYVSRDLAVARRYCEQLKPGTDQARRLQRIEEKQYRQTVQPYMKRFFDR
jgi:uncharacterized protein